jgi:hypothetical protein
MDIMGHPAPKGDAPPRERFLRRFGGPRMKHRAIKLSIAVAAGLILWGIKGLATWAWTWAMLP